jgi:DNA mismatch repair protein MutS
MEPLKLLRQIGVNEQNSFRLLSRKEFLSVIRMAFCSVSSFCLFLNNLMYMLRGLVRQFATAALQRNSKISCVFQLKPLALSAPEPKKRPTNLKREIDEIQTKNPSHILLIQVGMFYEIYDCGGYLDEIANLLGLRIGVHQKAAGSDHRYSRFAGFPTVSLRNHLDVLLRQGKTVAIVDQMKSSPISDIITRKVTRIVTPGTLLDDNDLHNTDNNFLLSIVPPTGGQSSKIGLAWVDVSTGEFNLSISSVKQIRDDLTRIAPKEILVPENLKESCPNVASILIDFAGLVTKRSVASFHSESSMDHLSRIIIENDPSKAIFASKPRDVLKGLKIFQTHAAGAILSYLTETFPCSTPSIRAPLQINYQECMVLDASTIDSLEITHTQRERSRKGSLVSVLDKTKTAAGHRLLISRLSAPSTVLSEIQRRLDLVEVFFKDQYFSRKILDHLVKCKDIERALQRIHFETGAPTDLCNIIQTLAQSNILKSLLIEKINDLPSESRICSTLNDLLLKMGDFGELSLLLNGLLNEESLSSNRISSIGVIRAGISDDLDREREIYNSLLEKQNDRLEELIRLFSKNLFNARGEMHVNL